MTNRLRDYDAVAQAVSNASTVREALERLGYTGRLHKYYPKLKDACRDFNLTYPSAIRQPTKIKSKRVSVFDDEKAVANAISSSTSYTQILNKLGVSSSQRNYLSLEKSATRFNLTLPPKKLRNYPSNRKGHGPGFFDKEVFVKAVEASSSGKDVLRNLGVNRDRDWLVRAAKFHEVTLPVGRSGSYPGNHVSRKAEIPLSQILVKGSKYSNNSTLKKRLIRAKFLKNRCSKCHLPPLWNGEILSLQLDHVNGVHDDNRLGNLRLLCPNCHSQTPTFAGKRKRRSTAV